MKVEIKNIKRKIILTILVILILSIIGCVVNFTKVYFNTPDGKTKIYTRELKDVIKLDGNKQVISILKLDINKDELEDYIVLLGEPKYEEVDTTEVHMFKSLNSNLEMYNNISVEYVNGKDKTTNRYDTKKTFDTQINISAIDTDKKVYVNVCDGSGNISLLHLKDEILENIVTNTLADKEFVGYTIEGKFKEDENTKLEIKLDNYGKDYLAKKEDTFILDYADTQVNKDNYRLTYMANKFSKFELEQSEDKSKTYLVCTQYILYSNNNTLNKNEGFIVSKFEIKDDNKLEFVSVEVTK